MAKQKRSLKLIATFDGEYADGWFFKVNKAFKEQLDIKKTERKKSGKTVIVETQGSEYSMYEGCLFSNILMLYSSKEEFQNILQQDIISIQVKQASPASNGAKGSVTFHIFKPSQDRTKLEFKKEKWLNQHDFIELLRTGTF